MSKSGMKERNKAIRKAWEREQQLVQEGKGTRDWTKNQQEDILDPDKGKAYDDQGRAFVGQHMKSAAKYPEEQGNPENIQFLTKDEHLEAHKGSWQNPTNWYYDPVTKEFHDFGDGKVVPCKIIELSNPVAIHELSGQRSRTNVKGDTTKEREEKKKEQTSSSLTGEQVSTSDIQKTKSVITKTIAPTELSGVAKTPKTENGFVKVLRSVGEFIVNHPIETVKIAGVLIGGTKLVYHVKRSRSNSGRVSASHHGKRTSDIPKTDISAKVASIVEKVARAENDVSGHKQRYHTKDGVVWRDKAPYHRGGKDI